VTTSDLTHTGGVSDVRAERMRRQKDEKQQQNEGLDNLYFPPNIILLIKLRMIR
jgi:hypothetical protein